jgi:Domain of unknown function (DUF4331)
MNTKLKHLGRLVLGGLLVASMSPTSLLASSHAEAPLISMDRYADNTDVYAFRSTEGGRSGFATIIANFVPFQDPSGGPQFYRFDDTVLYEIKIDNTGDGVEDITYQFNFRTQIVNGETVLGMNTVNENGEISTLTDADYNMPQTYSVRRVDRQTGRKGRLIASGLRTPPSNIGPRVTPNYEENLGSQAIYPLSGGGKVFAGQRDEGFYIDVGGVFDALNFRSIGMSGGIHTTQQYNVNSIAIEVPVSSLTRDGGAPTDPLAANAVIGVWSTASRQAVSIIRGNEGQGDNGRGNDDKDKDKDKDNHGSGDDLVSNNGPYRQVSRLGNPLVNEVVTPLRLKDPFNASRPTQDAQLVPYVLDPELAKLMQAVFGIAIPPPPRNDLAFIFALGIPAGVVPGYTTQIAGTNGPHEYLRLNLAIAPTANPNRLGLLGGDLAGFPNGRRVGDDVTDIGLRAVAGGTPFTPATNVAPNNTIGDGVSQNDVPYLERFPYLGVPHQGNQPRTANFPAP